MENQRSLGTVHFKQKAGIIRPAVCPIFALDSSGHNSYQIIHLVYISEKEGKNLMRIYLYFPTQGFLFTN